MLEKSFTAKLIQSKDEIKVFYTELKNCVLSFDKVTARMSKSRESFRHGTVTLARLTIKGDVLRIYLALDVNKYADGKYKVEDRSYVSSYADCSLMFRVTSMRKCEYAIKLIEDVMAQNGIVRSQDFTAVNYTELLPFESDDTLIAKGLIADRKNDGVHSDDEDILEDEDPDDDDRVFEDDEDLGHYYTLEKTFTAKLIQAKQEVKDYYSDLKNMFIAHYKVRARMSKKRESFCYGRKTIGRMTIRGKTLRLYLALDPKKYKKGRYKVEDRSYVSSYSDCSLMFRVNSESKCEYARDLIEDLMAQNDIFQDADFYDVDYAAQFPYETTDMLVKKGLITKKKAKPLLYDAIDAQNNQTKRR